MRRMETTSLEIFCSCADSPSDAPFLQQLEQHLSVLQREGSITLWHGRRIAAGSLRQEERDRHLHGAALIVLLVSSDFLASATCYHDMHQALQRRERNEAQVLPVLLRACDWQSAPLAALEMLPDGARPVSVWRDRDAAWTDVVGSIRRVLGGKPVGAAGAQVRQEGRNGYRRMLPGRRGSLALAGSAIALVLLPMVPARTISSPPVHASATPPATGTLQSSLRPDFVLPQTWKAPVPALSFASPAWENDPTPFECLYTAGVYQAGSRAGLNTCVYADSSRFVPTDIAVRMDVLLLTGPGAGLKIRSRRNNYYYFQIGDNGTFWFARHDDQTQDDVDVAGQKYHVTFGLRQWTTIQIIARGSAFSISINGQPAFAGSDSTLASGTIGVVVGAGDSGSSTAQFRNLEVECPVNNGGTQNHSSPCSF